VSVVTTRASSAVTHPAYPARRGARAVTWWGKAWVRAVEEAAYAETDLRRGRSLARAGVVGALTVDRGSVVAAVREGDDAWSVALTVPTLGDDEWSAFTELVAAEAGRIAALLAGDLPHTLVEHAEESGVELLPYGGELGTTCACDAWMQPCPHALAVMYQVAWLLDADPFSLLLLRGMPREALLAGLWERQGRPATGADAPDDDLETAVDAVERAARILELLGTGADADHLL
jgi:uncharacterized Zn finger protein